MNKPAIIRTSISLMILMTTVYAGGSITGTITFDGKVPTMRTIRMDSDPVCATKHTDNPTAEWMLVDEAGGVKNMLVYVKQGLGDQDFETPSEVVVLDQIGCQYNPHVLGVQVGQSLKILNSDGTLHNIHALPETNDEFNKAMPKFKKEMTVTFEETEAPFVVKCDVHPWMGGWIGVFDHPYFIVSGNDGSYTIGDLPAGEYIIEAWHEKLGVQEAAVSVKDGTTATADFTFTRPKKKK